MSISFVRRTGWYPLGVLLLVLFFFGFQKPSPSQAGDFPQGQLQEYVDRNADLFEWAREVVGETDNQPARRVLQEAGNLHQRSIRLLEQGHFQMAFNTAKRSRTAMRNAVRLARQSMGFEEQVRLRAERFRDRHAHWLELATQENNLPALKLLRHSKGVALRAREQYQQGDARLAFKMFEQAEELMSQAARLLSGAGGVETLDRQMESATEAVERAEQKLQESTDPAAGKLLSESRKALDRALDFRNQGQPGRALAMAKQALRLAYQAEGAALGAPSAAMVQRQIDRWDGRNQRVAEQGRRLLERARQQRERAAQSLARKELEPALRQIRAAHDLLSQAEETAR